MKKFLSLVCIVLGIWWISHTYTNSFQASVPPGNSPAITSPGQNPVISAESAILIDQKSGKILYQKNAHTQLYPASTTKILTALLALEYGDLDDVVTVGNEIQLVQPASSKAGLFMGQEIRLSDLLYGLMLPSGNDAAYTIAVYVAGKVNPDEELRSKEAVSLFVYLMNKKARSLGALESHFENPDGYHNVNHYSTAADLSAIAQAAMQYPFFRRVAATESYHYRSQESNTADSQQQNFSWKNTNLLLDQQSPYYDPAVTGLKTGHTKEAGYCLVASVARNNRKLIAVVLKASETGVWTDTRELLDFGFR